MQIPPMFSAKKIKGQKLCNLARQGKTIDRPACLVRVKTELLSYQYPFIEVRVSCSKGTYIRSIAHDLGKMLGCGAHLSALKRTRSGNNLLEQCLCGEKLYSGELTTPAIIAQLRKMEG